MLARLIIFVFLTFSINGLSLCTCLKSLAIKPMQKKARAGEKEAQLQLGIHYSLLETDEGFLMAAFWFGRAAEQNYRPALYLLGMLYERGQGVSAKDLAMALSLYQRAWNQGHTEALYRMGLVYQEMNDVENAFLCFSSASRRKVMPAKVSLGIMLQQGSWLPKNKENDFQALELFKEAAKAGNIDAMYLAGQMYEQGEEELRNIPRARNCYQEAAGLGHEEAKKRLAALP